MILLVLLIFVLLLLVFMSCFLYLGLPLLLDLLLLDLSVLGLLVLYLGLLPLLDLLLIGFWILYQGLLLLLFFYYWGFDVISGFFIAGSFSTILGSSVTRFSGLILESSTAGSSNDLFGSLVTIESYSTISESFTTTESSGTLPRSFGTMSGFSSTISFCTIPRYYGTGFYTNKSFVIVLGPSISFLSILSLSTLYTLSIPSTSATSLLFVTLSCCRLVEGNQILKKSSLEELTFTLLMLSINDQSLSLFSFSYDQKWTYNMTFDIIY